MASSVFLPPNRAVDTNGEPVSGAKAYFYETGTTTPLTVYADAALTTAHPSPLIADSSGFFADIFTDGSVDVKSDVFDENDVRLPGFPLDPCLFKEDGAAAASVSFTPTARISATDVQDAIEQVDSFVEALEDDNALSKTLTTTAGSSNAYTATISGVTALASGDTFRIQLDRANTGAATLNVSGLGAKDIHKIDGAGANVALVADDMQTGDIIDVRYDGTRFIALALRLNPLSQADLDAGTSTVEGSISPAKNKAAFDAHFAAASSGAGTEFIESETITNADEYDFTAFDDSKYSGYIFELHHVIPATTEELEAFTSADGVSFDTGSTDYAFVINGRKTGSGGGAGTDEQADDDAAAWVRLSDNTVSSSGAGASGTITLIAPDNTSEYTTFNTELNYETGSSNYAKVSGLGVRLSAAAVAGFRIKFDNSVQIASGFIVVRGILKA